MNCFVENEWYKLEYSIPLDLYKKGLCEERYGKNKFKFSGFIVAENKLFVVFPKGTKIRTDETKLSHDIYNLFGTLERYKNESNKLTTFDEELLGGQGSGSSIASAIWLIRDYEQHGIINFKKTEYKINKGKIDWTKTVQKFTPYFSNRHPVYLDFVTKSNESDINNIITVIHKYVILRCLTLFGPILGYQLPKSEGDDELPFSDGVAIEYLKQELHSTFSDREMHLFNNMVEFLSGSDENEESGDFQSFAVSHFHVVWEKMCSYFYSNSETKGKFPNPYWNVKGKIIKTSQIPDILFITNHHVIIIDAKYYTINNLTTGLPGWPDLVKQFFYSHTFRESFSNNLDVLNIFIFPGSCKGEIEYFGKAGVENSNSLGFIYAYEIDTMKAMAHYANYDKGFYKETLSLLISKEIQT